MYVDLWVLLMLGIFAAGMTWSSIARGRTIRCLKGCYYDLGEKAGIAFDHANTSDEFVSIVRPTIITHHEMIRRTGESPPSAVDVHYFAGER